MTETENNTRSLIFISHANPEDNYFSAWLAAKLNMLGYNAWVDVDELNIGDAFFNVIQSKIREEAIHLIAVNSEAYLEKAKDQNSGVARELNTAITVKGLNNFILPIRIDDVDFNDFPIAYSSWLGIDFYNNWQNGLVDLVRHLEKLNAPKIDEIENPIDNWFKAIKTRNKIIDRSETCYSNWFHFNLPEKIFFHRVNAGKSEIKQVPFPIVLESDYVITFANADTITSYLPLLDTKVARTKELLSTKEYTINQHFTLSEPEKKLVWLLNNCFSNHLRDSGLRFWREKNLNFFKYDSLKPKRISLKRHGKTGRALAGETKTKIGDFTTLVNWHYAINPRAFLHPFPHFRVYYTLVFTDLSGSYLEKTKSSELRRSTPSDWYNRKWYEMLLAAMLALSNSDEAETVSLRIDQEQFIEVENLPVGGNISVGYIEP